MALPKVKFKLLDIDNNLDSLIWYSKPENSKNSPLDFYKLTLKLFPELNGKIKENMSDEEVYEILVKEVKPILENLYKNSDDDDRYQLIWDKVNDNIMKDFEDKLKIKFPDDEITCRIGLLPVCLRDIIERTFDVNYGKTDDEIIATVIHELCHFYYFEKWKEIYEKYEEEELDSPHIIWYLSEAMIDPLINNETFKKYTNQDLSAYSSFYETYIDDKSIIDILRNYVNNNPIDEAIKKAFELFKKYEDIIKNNE